MLLRSLTKHVRDQNWFAVFLDFFIVVAGILIAFQITNWNEARLSERSDRAVLLQLHEEVLKAQSDLSSTRIDRPNIDEDTRSFVNAFFNEENDVSDDQLCFFASGSGGLPLIVASLNAVEELIATGRLSQLSDPELRELIAEFHERGKVGEALLPGYKTAFVDLMRSFPHYYEVDAYFDESGEVRIHTKCDTESMKADQTFSNAMARNLDIYDAWRTRFVTEPKAALTKLHVNIDRVLIIEHEAETK